MTLRAPTQEAAVQNAPSGLRQWLWTGSRHGPLPALLLALTVVAGVVDAVSILSLGRVFVANMTGNIVFIGFALAGAVGFSVWASLSALAGFLLGAVAGGRLVRLDRGNRGRLIASCAALQAIVMGVALGVAVVQPTPFCLSAQSGIALLAAVSMGIQNAVVRELAVPDLTTTVLTMTLTGLAADASSRPSAGAGRARPSALERRAAAVVAMLLGATMGALLVLDVTAWAALAVADVTLVIVAAVAVRTSRRDAPWQHSIKS